MMLTNSGATSGRGSNRHASTILTFLVAAACLALLFMYEHMSRLYYATSNAFLDSVMLTSASPSQHYHVPSWQWESQGNPAVADALTRQQQQLQQQQQQQQQQQRASSTQLHYDYALLEDSYQRQRRLTEHGLPPESCANRLHLARAENRNPRATQTVPSSSSSSSSQLLDPNRGQLLARYTSQTPYFYIAVHNKEYDSVRYPMFDTTGVYYEEALSRAFQMILSSSSESTTTTTSTTTSSDGQHHHHPSAPVKRVLDVGGNIGWFALLSAALGAQVATFEPHAPNRLRQCESQCLNGWLVPVTTTSTSDGSRSASSSEQHFATTTTTTMQACLHGDGHANTTWISTRIHVFPYAVSNRNGQAMIQSTSRNNPGTYALTATSARGLQTGATTPTTTARNVNSRASKPMPIRTVTLDDMVIALGWWKSDYHKNNTSRDQDDKIDILKVDVEGFELEVIQGAQNLLHAHVVHNIFMEGSMRDTFEQRKLKDLCILLVKSGYIVYAMGGYRGPNPNLPVPTSISIITNQDPDTADTIQQQYADQVVRACGIDTPSTRVRSQCNLWWTLQSATTTSP